MPTTYHLAILWHSHHTFFCYSVTHCYINIYFKIISLCCAQIRDFLKAIASCPNQKKKNYKSTKALLEMNTCTLREDFPGTVTVLTFTFTRQSISTHFCLFIYSVFFVPSDVCLNSPSHHPRNRHDVSFHTSQSSWVPNLSTKFI